MTGLSITLIMLACGACYLAAAWLDKKYQWRLVDWMNGEVNNPFSAVHAKKPTASEPQTVAALTERVQVLEKIVTEPAYELNKKINAL